MKSVLRHATLLALSGALSWWLFLRPPGGGVPEPPQVDRALDVALAPAPPAATAPQPETQPAPERGAAEERPPEPEPETDVEPEAEDERPHDSPPPPELGAPEGTADGAPTVPQEAASPEAAEAEGAPESVSPAEAGPPDAEGGQRSVAELMADPELVDAAREEFAGEVRQGFATVLLAAPEDQLAIARAFDEELVLVPKRALDPDARRPTYFRLRTGESPEVETVAGRPPLERYRQYRDFFDYEYRRLPAPLRSLRRSVLSRSEIYLFAALVPPAEWAVVVGRRREALARAGRDASEVRRFLLRYVRAGEGFDVRVEEVTFADGSRFRPAEDHNAESP